MTDHSDETEKKYREKGIEDQDSHIEHFYAQIREVPQLFEKALVVDQVLLSHFNEIQANASTLLKQFVKRKEEVLGKVDAKLFPIAKDALDQMFDHAEELSEQLKINLQNLHTTTKKDWIEHAKSWAQVYAKWYNNQELTEKVLKLVTERTSQLIDKDIKVIHDYQSQSLAHLSQETDEFKNVEIRLKQATEDSLKSLINLKKSPKDLSLKQASDWMARIHIERESHFDQLLIKIDSVIQDVVRPDNLHDDSNHFLELKGELVFIEHEVQHVQELISELNLTDKKNVDFLIDRLKEVEEHLEQFDLSHLPNELEVQVDRIQKLMKEAKNNLKEDKA